MRPTNTSYAKATFALFLLTSLVVLSTVSVEAKKYVTNGRIAFLSYRLGPGEVFTMNQDGSNPVNLSNNPAIDANPSWSPGGKKIAFDSTRDGSAEIYVMNADGTNQTRITNAAGTNSDPAWSPDGTKIAFQSNRDGNFEIYVMNADGSGQTRLTNNPASDFHCAWSPDSSRIVFDSLRDGNSEIYIMNANGTNQLRLTNNPTLDSSASFSPDGDRIVFHRHFNAVPQVMLMNPNGTNVVQLTSSGAHVGPTFTADGQKILFNDFAADLFIMNADGSDSTQLTNNPAPDVAAASQPVLSEETVGVFRPSTSQFLLRNSNTAGAPDITITFGQTGDLPLAGDWNGDGTTEVGVFRNGQFLLRKVTIINLFSHSIQSVTTATINFGQAGDLPVAGDWNADGVDTVGVFRPSTGQWFLTNAPNTNNSSPVSNPPLIFGLAGDTPLAGDWDNDGLDTVGLFRPSVSTFILSNNLNGSVDITPFVFGSLGSLPFTGDWDAEGTDTVGTFNKNLGAMGLNNTNASGNGVGDILFNFGQNGDIPLAGDWDGKP